METLSDCAEGEGGFTLIEILVSFAILVAAIAVLHGGFGGGWRNVRAANMEAEALEVARTSLAVAGIESPLEAGVSDRDAGGGFSLRVIIEPHGGDASDKPVKGYWTTVQVRWNDGRSTKDRQISLTTLKIKRPVEGQP